MTNNQFKEITNIIDNLETKGLFKQADSLNNILIKIAQQTQPAKPTPDQIKYYQANINNYRKWANDTLNKMYHRQNVNLDSIKPEIYINTLDKTQLTSQQLTAFSAQANKIYSFLANNITRLDYEKNTVDEAIRNQTMDNAYEDKKLYDTLKNYNILNPNGQLNPQIKTKQQLANLINKVKNETSMTINYENNRSELNKSYEQALDQVYNLYSIRLK
jgi:hypothetical protein